MSVGKGILGFGTICALGATAMLILISILQEWVYVEIKSLDCIVGNLGLYTSSFTPECALGAVPGESLIDIPTKDYWPLFAVQTGFGSSLEETLPDKDAPFATYGISNDQYPDGDYTCEEGVNVTINSLQNFPRGALASIQSTLCDALQGALTYGIWGAASGPLQGPAPFDVAGLDTIAAGLVTSKLIETYIGTIAAITTVTLTAADNTTLTHKAIFDGAIDNYATGFSTHNDTSILYGDLSVYLPLSLISALEMGCDFGVETIAECAQKVALEHTSGAAALANPATVNFVEANGYNLNNFNSKIAPEGPAGYPLGTFYSLATLAHTVIVSDLTGPPDAATSALMAQALVIRDTFVTCANDLSLSEFARAGLIPTASMTVTECMAQAQCGEGDLPDVLQPKAGDEEATLPYTLFNTHDIITGAVQTYGSYYSAIEATINDPGTDNATVALLDGVKSNFIDSCIALASGMEAISFNNCYRTPGCCLPVVTDGFIVQVLGAISVNVTDEDAIDADGNLYADPDKCSGGQLCPDGNIVPEWILAGLTGEAAVVAEYERKQSIVTALAVKECEDDATDLAAIELAQVLIPVAIGCCGLGALLGLGGLIVATKGAGIVAGILSLAGGAISAYALLNVQSAPVYANVGLPCADDAACYKEDSAALYAKIGILCGLVAGLMQVVGALVHKDSADSFSEMKDVGMYAA